MMKQRRQGIKRLVLKSFWIGTAVLLVSFLSIQYQGGRFTGQVLAASLEELPALMDTVALPQATYSLTSGHDSLLLPVLPDGEKEYKALQAFFDGLDSLRAGKDTVISVVQLGDSHIQAGHYSGQVMRLLQSEFGNAGRGLVVPLKLSKTNEPDDYFITSVVKEWIAGRSIQNTKKTPIGLGGIGIQTESPSVNLNVYIAPTKGAGYAFNQAVLYRSDKAMPMLPTGPMKDSVEACLADTPFVPGVMADTFRISYLADTLQLHSTRRKQGTDQLLPASSFTNTYYGLNLTNGQPGILYHSIGVNGAMYANYTEEAYVRQLALLNPSLLIISLGTNETFARHFSSEEFTAQVKDFLHLVKKYLPHTSLLLTTPPECYRKVYVKKKRTYVRNDYTAQAAKVITSLARKEGIACWDLFSATGGKNSCRKWFNADLMARDRVHFTREAYQEQGTLLYRALMQTYNSKIAE